MEVLGVRVSRLVQKTPKTQHKHKEVVLVVVRPWKGVRVYIKLARACTTNLLIPEYPPTNQKCL